MSSPAGNVSYPDEVLVPTFEGRPLPDPAEPAWDQGLAFDVETLLDRRQALKVFGRVGLGAGLVTLAACSPAASALLTRSPSATSAGASGSAAACAVIPEETAGPFPGDGSNGPDILTQSGVVRSDITASFGTSTNVAPGVPLTIRLTVLDLARGCAPLAGAAAYVWHCDRAGNYSMYSQAAQNENYLRGVQAAGADGVITFKSIFPACYSGRWPHIHFEIYPSLEKATDPAKLIATSQIALPKDSCDTVYATTGYEQSVSTLSQVSLASDNVFGDDGGIHELGTVGGTVATGLTVELAVPVIAGSLPDMPANDYHFITNWLVPATREEITEVLGDAEGLARWWPSVYLGVAVVEPGASDGVGRIVDLYTKGWLPYALRWQFKVTESNAPHGFRIEANGDFVGRGIWTLEEERSRDHRDGPLTRVVYDWEIVAEKGVLRALSPIMKPIFGANHRWAMARGEESLLLEIRRRHAPETAARAAVPQPPGPTFPHNLRRRARA